jgi:hypothetical protein
MSGILFCCHFFSRAGFLSTLLDLASSRRVCIIITIGSQQQRRQEEEEEAHPHHIISAR